MSETTHDVPFWKQVLFSATLAGKSRAKIVAYIGVVAALCIVTNTFEIKFASVQFSFTVFSSVLAGILIGPLFGFCAVFLGDAVGYFINSAGYYYYWWVALAVACMALISGLVMNGLRFRFRGGVYVKLALVCLLTFLLCSIGINTTGMYFIGLRLYMPRNVLSAIADVFGGRFNYWIYVVIRFFLLGQIYNSLLNYALLFCSIPALSAIKPLKIALN